MCATAWSKPTYLSIDELQADPKLARLLPREVAYRFHALPVAEQGGRITVVMANPEDGEALSAIAGVLGREPCVVQGDAQTIDASLARVWSQVLRTSLTLLVCRAEGPAGDRLRAYARTLGELLHAKVKDAGCESGLEALATGRSREPDDLLVVGGADSPLIGPWLEGGWESQVPPALLVAHRPLWPLRHILLIVCGEEADSSATDWVLRLARADAAAVKVLAVVPPPAALHEQRRTAAPGHARDRQGLPALLSADTPFGYELQAVARRLEGQGIPSSLRLCQGPPEWQLRRELAGQDHDLVVMALQPGEQGQGRSEALAATLLRWSGRPTLIARPVSW